MAQKSLPTLVNEIVSAYETFAKIETDFGQTKPELLEVARNALRDRIYEARDLLNSRPSVEETPVVTVKSRGGDGGKK